VNVQNCKPSAHHLLFSSDMQISQINKKAQLSLGKTQYSQYSSCCRTDLQGHPRSM